MKKRDYYDLHLKPKNIIEAVKMIYAAKYMDFAGIGLNIANLIDEERDFNLKIFEEKARELGVKIIYILEGKHVDKKTLKKFDPLKTLVLDTAETESKFRKHLRNPDIHVISTPINAVNEIVNTSNLNLLKQTNKALEITLKPLWSSNNVELQRLLKNIYKVTWLLNKKNKIYVSSGSTQVTEMRNPRAIRSYLRVIGIKDEKTIYMLSKLPGNIIFETKPVIYIKADESESKKQQNKNEEAQ